MPKADAAHITARRAVLSLGALVPFAGLTVPPNHATDPDAALMRAVRRVQASAGAMKALDDRSCHPSDDELDSALERTWRDLDRLRPIRPRTFPGLVAKTRVIRDHYAFCLTCTYDARVEDHALPAELLVWQVLNDLVGLGDGSAA